MFKFNNLRRRVSLHRSDGVQSVRIERQNTRDLYIWGFCLITLMFVLAFRALLGAARLHADQVLYISPMFALVVLGYVIAIAICIWGAFGVEEIQVESDELRWTRTALKWRRTRHFPKHEISDIRAITPWHGLDNTVEITVGRKQERVGGKLLRDEAIDLAQFLRKAVGLHG